MVSPSLHHDANAKTLASARVFIFALWLAKLLLGDFAALGHLSSTLFHPFGVMKLLPHVAIEWLTNPLVLTCYKGITLVLIVWVIFGVGQNKLALVLAAALLTLYFGFAKGYGGHVNHRELILLYLTYLLIPLPCFSALAIKRAKDQRHRDAQLYQACMLVLCGAIVLNYFFVGMARLCIGFPEVFDPQVMYNWVLSRNLRPNPYHNEFGLLLLSSEMGRLLLAMALPLSTVVELLAPAMLWSGKTVRRTLILFLGSFHLAIFLLMNIAFFENIALLALLCNYTAMLERKPSSTRLSAKLEGSAA